MHHSLHTINDSITANSNQDKLNLQDRYSTQKRTDSLPVNSNQGNDVHRITSLSDSVTGYSNQRCFFHIWHSIYLSTCCRTLSCMMIILHVCNHFNVNNFNKSFKDVYIISLAVSGTCHYITDGIRVRSMVLNATFSNISAISWWWSVLLMEKTRVPREKHRPVTGRWQTLSRDVVSSTSRFRTLF